MRKFIAVTCAFFITVSLWALEPDDKAIVGVWLLDGDYKDEFGNGNKGKDIVETLTSKMANLVMRFLLKEAAPLTLKILLAYSVLRRKMTIAAWFRVDADSDTGSRKMALTY